MAAGARETDGREAEEEIPGVALRLGRETPAEAVRPERTTLRSAAAERGRAPAGAPELPSDGIRVGAPELGALNDRGAEREGRERRAGREGETAGAGSDRAVRGTEIEGAERGSEIDGAERGAEIEGAERGTEIEGAEGLAEIDGAARGAETEGLARGAENPPLLEPPPKLPPEDPRPTPEDREPRLWAQAGAERKTAATKNAATFKPFRFMEGLLLSRVPKGPPKAPASIVTHRGNIASRFRRRPGRGRIPAHLPSLLDVGSPPGIQNFREPTVLPAPGFAEAAGSKTPPPRLGLRRGRSARIRTRKRAYP